MKNKPSDTSPDNPASSSDSKASSKTKESGSNPVLDNLARFALSLDEPAPLDLNQGSVDQPREEVHFGTNVSQEIKKSSDNLYKGAGLGLLVLALLTGTFFYLASLSRKSAAPPPIPESGDRAKTAAKHLEIASVYMGLENLEKAENEIQAALRADPENARAYKQLGDLYKKKNQFQGAIDAYQKAALRQPTFYEPLLELALIHEESNNFSEAAKYYQRAIQARPKEIVPHLRLATLYSRAELKEEALKEYQQCLALNNLDSQTEREIQGEVAKITRFLKTHAGAAQVADLSPSASQPAPVPDSRSTLPGLSNPTAPAEPLELKSKVSLPPAEIDRSQPVVRQEATPAIGKPADEPAKSVELAAKPLPKLQSPELNPPAPQNPPPAPAIAKLQIKQGDLVPIEEVDSIPVLVRKQEPRAPAKTKNFSGKAEVLLSVLISETGNVIETKIIRRPENDLGFSQAAQEAVRQWRYKPAVKNGVKVKVWRVVQVFFNM
jgi:TonB family protein